MQNNLNRAVADEKIADKKNLSKSSFLSAVAHDIRSPAGAIAELAKMLTNKKLNQINKKEEIDFLQNIKQSASELTEFANDLLDIGQTESGNFQLKSLTKADVATLIKRSIKIVEKKALMHHIQIKTSIENNLPKLKCDERRIKQILVNLLVNSVKYSQENTVITVIAKKTNEKNNKIMITVKDQGLGIKEEDIKKALQKYTTINNKNSEKVDSLGLGLPLVKHLIELHNGTLEIKSQINKGSEFIIKL